MKVSLVPIRTLVHEEPLDGGPGIDAALPSFIVSTVMLGDGTAELAVFRSDPNDRAHIDPLHYERNDSLQRFHYRNPPSHAAIASFHDEVCDAYAKRRVVVETDDDILVVSRHIDFGSAQRAAELKENVVTCLEQLFGSALRAAEDDGGSR